MKPPNFLARSLIWSLLWTLLWATGPAIAADADQASTTETAAQKTDAEKTDPGTGDSAEVFIPSEEISEDFTVSFPVDI